MGWPAGRGWSWGGREAGVEVCVQGDSLEVLVDLIGYRLLEGIQECPQVLSHNEATDWGPRGTENTEWENFNLKNKFKKITYLKTSKCTFTSKLLLRK